MPATVCHDMGKGECPWKRNEWHRRNCHAPAGPLQRRLKMNMPAMIISMPAMW